MRTVIASVTAHGNGAVYSASRATVRKLARCSICNVQVFPDTPATQFMHSFWRLRQVLIERVSPVLREAHDLEIAEVFLLGYIGRSDLSPSEIAEQLRIPAHAISRKLDVLEKRRFIVRSLDPSDARRRVLALTPAGETLLERAAALLERQVAELLNVLSSESLTNMLAAMDRVTHTLTRDATPRSATPAQEAP